ncbi:MAG TPA: type II secretion system F family protein [Phycisphaerales bacterium]|nr:type II secretion system F family protein [Phycisphaerales bacterium]
MATFQYEAIDKAGKRQKGTVEAASSEEAIQRIKLQQLFPTAVREQKVKKSAAAGEAAAKPKKKKGGGFSIGRVKPKVLTTFTRQLSTLQDAGLPLLRSLQILEQQQRPGLLKNILTGVVEDVQGGASLSEAMAKHPRAFDGLYCKMVNAGEIGGVLDVILQRLAEFMEKAERLKRKIKGAMIYPVTVIIIAVGIVTGIMYFIIPKFKDIFADFDVALPVPTVLLINTSAWVAGNYPTKGAMMIGGWAYILFGAPLVWVGFKMLRKTRPGKAVIDTLGLYIPVAGKLARKSIIARFTRTLGTLVAAGVPILEAISITRDTSGNYVFYKALNKVHDSIREGETFAQPLRESKVCDSIVVNMIDVGEETGDLDTMLLKIADNYDDEVDTAVEGLVKLIEPLLVVFLGGIIGTIVVAMFLPLVGMIEGLQKRK